MQCSLIKLPMRSPNDMSAIKQSIEEGSIKPEEVIAVLGKTEGNGCVNDFTRGFAVQSLSGLFQSYQQSPISYVMSGGTEGILSPHYSVICKSDSSTISKYSLSNQRALAIGVAKTARFKPQELGRLAQVEQVAEAVLQAMKEAGIQHAADVHFVQVKCPLLTAEQVQEAYEAGELVVTEDTYKSMGYSRGASALGVAIALGEIDRAALQEEEICSNWELYSKVASTSAGSELQYCEVIVFGNSDKADGPYFIDHDVMMDAIDGQALIRILNKYPEAEVVQVLAKAEAAPTGVVRGRRHTMLDDSDINHTRHARAVVGGVLASICGDPMIYVSGGAEHQGPAGGGPVAVVFRHK